MHPISINLYTFGELAPEVQRKVVEHERYINVEDHFWYEPIIEDWTEQLEQLGFENVKILFSGFGSQGDGACFTAAVNIEQFLHVRGLLEGSFPEVIDAAKRALVGVTIRLRTATTSLPVPTLSYSTMAIRILTMHWSACCG
jgi:hypothetical protein